MSRFRAGLCIVALSAGCGEVQESGALELPRVQIEDAGHVELPRICIEEPGELELPEVRVSDPGRVDMPRVKMDPPPRIRVQDRTVRVPVLDRSGSTDRNP